MSKHPLLDPEFLVGESVKCIANNHYSATVFGRTVNWEVSDCWVDVDVDGLSTWSGEDVELAKFLRTTEFNVSDWWAGLVPKMTPQRVMGVSFKVRQNVDAYVDGCWVGCVFMSDWDRFWSEKTGVLVFHEEGLFLYRTPYGDVEAITLDGGGAVKMEEVTCPSPTGALCPSSPGALCP
jgi:hypothetical protein